MDLGSFAPREYHLERMSQEQGLTLPGDLGWYRRVENNGWRPLAVRFAAQSKVDKAPDVFFSCATVAREPELVLMRLYT